MSREVISRYESKYLVTEGMVEAIREYLRGICSPDRHAGPDGRYRVNNLYFDTPDLRFYHDTRFKQFTRFKPRVRFYGAQPEDWLWLELKHKVKNVTWKVRRRVDVSELPRLFDNPRWHMERRAVVSLHEGFEDAVTRFGASPILQVRYVREPWVSDIDDYGRVTFDRCLACRPIAGPDSMVAGEPFVPFDDPVSAGLDANRSPVVLEIKTDVQVPAWVNGLVRCFGLQRTGFSKYCNGLERACSEMLASGRVSAVAPRPVTRGAEAGTVRSRMGQWAAGLVARL